MVVGGLLLPAGMSRCWFACLDEQILDELAGLHLVELLHTDTEEHLGQIFRDLFGDAGVLVDDAKDKTLLAVGAVPGITHSFRLLVLSVAVLATITVNPIGAAVAIAVPVAIAVSVGFRNKAGVLDFLIDGVLQKFVELLNFRFDLGDVGEFDFNRCAKTVTAELRQPEFFAVVGAEFDSHDVVGGGMWAQKSQTVIGLA